MAEPDTFQTSDNSLILTPEATGLATLVTALGQGSSIHATQSDANPVQIKPGAPQQLYCETAGTTGPPKVIRRRPKSWVRSFEINRDIFDLGAHDTYAVLGGLGHSLSLYATLEALHLGADLAVLAHHRPKTQARGIAKASVLYATPTQLRLLCSGVTAAGLAPQPEIRRIFCGGGRLDAALKKTLAQHFPNAELRVFFGASETSFITISDATTPEGSVGRAYPDVTIDIRSHTTHSETMGEIWVSSPYLFDGYETGASRDTKHDGTALSIGEMGYQDANGYLFLLGRKNRMVTVADQNVFPEEIERVVAHDPQVRACAALAVDDPKRGHHIVCVVEADPDPALDLRLRKACQAALGQISVPRHIQFTDHLPVLPAGKPNLRAIRAMIEDKP